MLTLCQTVAWIMQRDPRTIEAFDERKRSHIGAPWSLAEVLVRLAKAEPVDDSALKVTTTYGPAKVVGTRTTKAWENALSSVIDKAQAGTINVLGRHLDRGQATEIPTAEWSALRFADDPPRAVPIDYPRVYDNWWGTLRFLSAQVVAEWPAASSGKAEKECQAWLTGLMRAGPPTQNKEDYLANAKGRLARLSDRGFNRAWDMALADTGNAAWKKSGPKTNSVRRAN